MAASNDGGRNLIFVYFCMAVAQVAAFSSAVTSTFYTSTRKPPFRTCLLSQLFSEDLHIRVIETANELWGLESIPMQKTTGSAGDDDDDDELPPPTTCQGEARYDSSTTPYSERAAIFERDSFKGCPKAQHSYGLLLWSGFGGVSKNAVSSAKWHAAAATQGHLDAIAVFGGCLRTGTGAAKEVELGLELIDCSASLWNPTGVNKKAALLENSGDDDGDQAFELYHECYNKKGNINALLVFNLGWCYMNGIGVAKDSYQGERLWKEAATMAPDEGSEEAAWFLYEHFRREDPKEAEQWLEKSQDLGYYEV